ncbi:MAG: hypothetical protein LBI28_04270 [Treponema sp.]|jgi:predicted heme/steroid binding protein|nr:hypothetical protein [Treponema sp.]
MVSKKILFGMLAVALVFGMSVIGCEPEGNTDPKSITITGLNTYNGRNAAIYVVSDVSYFDEDDDDTSYVAAGGANSNVAIAGGQVTLELKEPGGSVFTGNGPYWIGLQIKGLPKVIYVYTNGASVPENTGSLPKFSIDEASSTIDLGKFKDVTSNPDIDFNIVIR